MRIRSGERVLDLEQQLAGRVHELEKALREIRVLKGLPPICMYCKKVRDDADYWHQIEVFIAQRTDAEFTHSICPACAGDETIVSKARLPFLEPPVALPMG